MEDKIPRDVIVLAEAYGMHIRALGKYWALAATVTVIAITADTSSSNVEFFGFPISSAHFYPACAIFGAILNFAYCVSHIQGYRSGQMFRDYLETIRANDQQFTNKSTVVDAAHLLYPSAINRVYPIRFVLPKFLGARFIQLLKFPVDLFVFALPPSGCLYAAVQLDYGWLSLAIWILVIVSLMVSLLLLITGVKWLFATQKSSISET